MEKYAIAKRAKTTDIQKGMKSIENNNAKKAKIRSAIFLYYPEASFDASPV